MINNSYLNLSNNISHLFCPSRQKHNQLKKDPNQLKKDPKLFQHINLWQIWRSQLKSDPSKF
jgi:hypothetical protein